MPQYWTPQALGPLAQSESGGQPSLIHGGGSSATGLYGFVTGTWQTYAPQAGVSLVQYPYAYLAPADVQSQVAAVTPISNWTCPGCNSTAVQLAQDPSNVTSTPGGGIGLDPNALANPSAATDPTTGAVIPGASGNPITQAAGGLGAIGTWFANWFVRGGVVILGLVLLAAAAFELSKQRTA